ncbi:hypothetical protein [Dankookia sp. P2]|uniref:dioxygenase family protein n=1 Tax=Dankookia sp. P2 TaxID=3423955 RepID=UPI003D66B6DA
MLFGTVTDAEGKPVPEAEIDIWQTDAHGQYDLQANDPEVMDLRGRYRTDAAGRYHMRTVKPIGYSIPMDGPVEEVRPPAGPPRHAAGPYPRAGPGARLPGTGHRALSR